MPEKSDSFPTVGLDSLCVSIAQAVGDDRPDTRRAIAAVLAEKLGDWTVRAADYTHLAVAAAALRTACKRELPVGCYAMLDRECRSLDSLLRQQPTPEETSPIPKEAAALTSSQLLDLCRGWLTLQIAREGCLTTAGDVLDDLRMHCESQEAFIAAIFDQKPAPAISES